MPNTYEPGEVPSFEDESLNRLVGWLQTELHKIANSFQPAADVLWQKTYVAPTKPQTSEVRWADGTSWNPGGGAGLYEYTGGGANGWRMLASGTQY